MGRVRAGDDVVGAHTGASPAAVMTTRAPRPGVEHDRRRRVARVKAMLRGSRLASPDMVPRIQGTSAVEGREAADQWPAL